MKRGFASDNNAGVHPLIMDEILRANEGHMIAYGNDPFTSEALEIFKGLFGHQSETFFVFTGTSANVLALDSCLEPFKCIICPDTAHIYEDECGAPERYTGSKLIPVCTPDGKLTPNLIKEHIEGVDFEHHVQPGVVSISQSTEMGTVYSVEEIAEICECAHRNSMYVHMDGARIANAAVSLDRVFYDFTTAVGLDVLSFGGTKNGLLCGEAVVFLNKELAKNFKYRRKQAMQLASKMRFLSAQFIGYFKEELWKKNALHANNMARLLYKNVSIIPEVKVTQMVQANGVFARIPGYVIGELQSQYFFYEWDETNHEVRWMTSYDTTKDDVLGFVEALKNLI